VKTKSAFYKVLETLFPNFNRVCIVTNCYPPYPKDAYSLSVGGISKKYEEITDELRYFKKELSVISLYYIRATGDQDSTFVNRIGVYYPYTIFKGKRIYLLMELFNPLVFLKCISILAKDRPDVVVIGSTFQISLAPILAAKLLGIQVIVQHDWLCPCASPRDGACNFGMRISGCGKCLEEMTMSKQRTIVKSAFGFYSAFMLIAKKYLWNKCLVLAEGEFFKNIYEASGIRSERIYLAPPSATVDCSTDRDREFFDELNSVIGSSKVIAYVGRLSREKGVDILLDSFRILKENIKSVKLVIAGDGMLSDLVREESARSASVMFLGWLQKERLVCVYRLTDIVVIPTILPEVYPHVALEALAFGKKVVGFEMGGLVEIAKKNKLVTLVAKTDPQSLANAMLTLLDSEK
jgi:glycosyltransferase involved in cell wall biosynthesis